MRAPFKLFRFTLRRRWARRILWRTPGSSPFLSVKVYARSSRSSQKRPQCPLTVVSRTTGHDSEETTKRYLSLRAVTPADQAEGIERKLFEAKKSERILGRLR